MEREVRDQLVLENVTLGLWTSGRLHITPQNQTDLSTWSVMSNNGFSAPTPAWDLHWSWPRHSVFEEAKQECVLPGLPTRERGKKGLRRPLPIPYPQLTSQKFRSGANAELLSRGKRHQKWGRIPTLPHPPLSRYYDVTHFCTGPRAGSTSPCFSPAPITVLGTESDPIHICFQK